MKELKFATRLTLSHWDLPTIEQAVYLLLNTVRKAQKDLKSPLCELEIVLGSPSLEKKYRELVLMWSVEGTNEMDWDDREISSIL